MEVREPALAYNKQHYSIEEYLELENAADEKHEYYKGEIFAMSGARMAHNEIATSLLVALGSKLKGKPCRPYGSDLRIHIPSNTLFTYPDISVICGGPETRNGDDMNALNPTVIIEVLSPSTRKYDRGDKFTLYREIPTLREYVLIDSTAVHVEAFAINKNGFWELRECKTMDDTLHFPSLSVDIPLSEVYEHVKFVGSGE